MSTGGVPPKNASPSASGEARPPVATALSPANSAGRVKASVKLETSKPKEGTGQANTAAGACALSRYFCTTSAPIECPISTGGAERPATALATSSA